MQIHSSDIFYYILFGFFGLLGLYVVVRLVCKAMFRSFFEGFFEAVRKHEDKKHEDRRK